MAHPPDRPVCEAFTPLRLAALKDIPDGACLGIPALAGGPPVDLFLVRRGDRIRGFVNSCPHTGVNLEWLPHGFLDAGGEHIQCKTHGALFDVDDGRCLAGPCAGRGLRRCELRLEDGAVWLTAPPPPPFG